MRAAIRVLALLLVLGSTSLARAASPEPFQVNAILSLTGSGAFLGKAQQLALQVAQAEVNRTGGIRGRPLEFAIADDQSNPQVAVQLANGLIAKGVPIVIGSSLVAACNAMAALMKNGPVLYCLSAGAHPARGSYEFTYGVSTTDGIAVDVRYFRERGLRKVAIMTTTDASGQDADRGIDEVLSAPENHDVAVVAREHFNAGDVSVAAQTARIKASGAQFLIGWAVGAPFGTLLHGARDVGLGIPIATSAGNLVYSEMKRFADIVPANLYFSGLPCAAPDSLPRGPVRDAVARFYDAFKAAGYRADQAYGIGWDPAWITINAFRKLGTGVTAAQIRAYLEGLHGWAGANGAYDFRDGSQRGLTARNDSLMVRWDAAKDTWVAESGFGGVPLASK